MDAQMLDMARLPWVARAFDRFADLVESPPGSDGAARLETALWACNPDERAEIVRYFRSLASIGAITA